MITETRAKRSGFYIYMNVVNINIFIYIFIYYIYIYVPQFLGDTVGQILGEGVSDFGVTTYGKVVIKVQEKFISSSPFEAKHLL